MNEPLISLIFPLYKSKRFLDLIIANIEAVEYPNVEFLFGDRHLFDDAMDVLSQKYLGDDRFRFYRFKDKKGWLDNLNFLISKANGNYYRFMPHDDSFPICGLNCMVEEFNLHPDSILVFSPVKHFHLDDPKKKLYQNDDNLKDFNNTVWNDQWILNINSPMKAKGSFRGLIDLDKVRKAGLEIKKADLFADRYFLFGLAIIGRFRVIEAGASIKMMHSESVSAGWSDLNNQSPKKNLYDFYKMQSHYINLLIDKKPRRMKFKTSLFLKYTQMLLSA